MRKRRSFPRTVYFGTIALAFFAGLCADHVARAARRTEPGSYRPLDAFADVLAHIENSYIEPVDERELVYGAIEGMIARLDPHSAFMRKDVYQAMRDEADGEYEGLGIEATVSNGVLTVVSPLADSPAERAGLLPGDRIDAINDEPTREMALAEAVRRFRGPSGSKVTLEIMREGFSAPQHIEVICDRVSSPRVETRILDRRSRLVYVRLRSFADRTDRSVSRALGEARAELRGGIGGLVLDLRNNPGGLLDQAVRVSDLFLSSGIIVSTEGRGGRDVEVERAHEKDTEPNYPIVLLVNRGTASASEIVAGALQDHGRAFVMGTPTFGKGSVQAVIELEDGSGLKLTVARYYTPKHRSIQELGITPDQIVAGRGPFAAEDSLTERDLKNHLPNGALPAKSLPLPTRVRSATNQTSHVRDEELLAAVAHLRAELSTPGKAAFTNEH